MSYHPKNDGKRNNIVFILRHNDYLCWQPLKKLVELIKFGKFTSIEFYFWILAVNNQDIHFLKNTIYYITKHEISRDILFSNINILCPEAIKHLRTELIKKINNVHRLEDSTWLRSWFSTSSS